MLIRKILIMEKYQVEKIYLSCMVMLGRARTFLRVELSDVLGESSVERQGKS